MEATEDTLKVEQLSKLIVDALQGWGDIPLYYFDIIANSEDVFRKIGEHDSEPSQDLLEECGFGDEFHEIAELRRALLLITQELNK